MVKAGQSLGLTLEQSKTLVLQTFTGATTLASLSAEDFNTLRQRVTSPGGVTEAAIKSMQKNRVEEHIFSAIHVAYLRTQQFSETKA
jgi:pyrroline-5-carboxylate reductase